MFSALHWFKADKDPTFDNISFQDFEIEVFMSQEPYVQTLTTFGASFDFSSRNYRLESIIMIVLFVVSLTALLFFLCFKMESFTSVNEKYQNELATLERDDS